ncbi:MAG: dihydrofolate reductase [Bacteroidales bacterium]|nr:dihydrofolate reductase [Bacteroidales bacterium]
MKKMIYLIVAMMMVMMVACNGTKKEKTDEFKWQTEQFADLRVLRYQIPGWDELTLKQKELVYYLSQAALCGRDITYNQNYKNNLLVRNTLEAIYKNYKGDRSTQDFSNFLTYLKRVWFSNGIHHHYSMDKFFPDIQTDYFTTLLMDVPPEQLPLKDGQTQEEFTEEITTIIFDPEVAPKRVSLDASTDMVEASACNFYEGVTQQEAEDFYAKKRSDDLKAGNNTRISYGLNSRLVKKEGEITEQVWKLNGMYHPAIEKILYWLEKAATVTETPEQKAALDKLIEFYETGDLVAFDDYSILWLNDQNSDIDFINGFIETYGDPLSMKATWESVVNFKDKKATERTIILAGNAQYFEDNSPVDPEFKKKEVKGVSAKVINVAQLGGDCDPTTPIGINLPNAEWIRKDHGSKSVTMENITYAYDQSSLGNGFLEEFAWSPEEIQRQREYGFLAGNLTTDMHECLGHAAGQLLPGTSPDAMKNYHSTLEEARADLFALYYIMDPKLMVLGLVPSMEVGKAEYDNYIRNGYLTQLVRIQPGKDVEESHMRDRKLIATWCYEKGKEKNIIELLERDGKTYIRINDYEGLRNLFGELLNKIQRIKSTGDYETGKELVETYAVKVDQELHNQMLKRYKKLNIAPYGGFINPVLTPVFQDDTLSDILVTYPDDFTGQMMTYSNEFSYLPARCKND